MRLTLFTDYGLRVLIYLALRPGRLVSIAEMADAYAISENHMIKVVHALGRSGFVETLRGRNGGVRLDRPADGIVLGEVVRAMEPQLGLAECHAGVSCAVGGCCRLQGILDEALGALLAVLDRYTIADIAAPGNRALRRRLGLTGKPAAPQLSGK